LARRWFLGAEDKESDIDRNGFPLCACFEGLTGAALLDRSCWLSSLAGWPAHVDPG
jgi:hypothetical protein